MWSFVRARGVGVVVSQGTAIGKFSMRYEDFINVAATAIIGAYVQLQVRAHTNLFPVLDGRVVGRV